MSEGHADEPQSLPRMTCKRPDPEGDPTFDSVGAGGQPEPGLVGAAGEAAGGRNIDDGKGGD